MTPRFSYLGKEVLFDGQHYADACDQMAAAAIAHAMNSPCARKLPLPARPSDTQSEPARRVAS